MATEGTAFDHHFGAELAQREEHGKGVVNLHATQVVLNGTLVIQLQETGEGSAHLRIAGPFRAPQLT